METWHKTCYLFMTVGEATDKTGKDGPSSRHKHPEHMHIEVKDKGGFIGKGYSNLGKPEFVLDHDTTKFQRTFLDS